MTLSAENGMHAPETKLPRSIGAPVQNKKAGTKLVARHIMQAEADASHIFPGSNEA
jgi:hypothetical protein